MKMNKKIISIVTSLTVITMMMPMAPVMATISAGCRANISTCTFAEATEYLAELTALYNTLQGQQTGGGTTYTGIPTGFTFTKNLSQGMTDSDVVNLKIVLAAKECVTGLSNNQYFGSLTLAGVKCFQNKYKTEISAFAGYTISASGFVGAGTRAQLNALLAGGPVTGCITNADCATGKVCQLGVCVTVPVGAPLSVSLNAASPVSANIVTGSANNVVAILDFVGSASAATQINTLRLNSYGTVNPNAATDISGIKIFDGANQVGFTMTLIGGQATFTFAPAIAIPAGGTKQLKVTADIAATGVATVMTTVRFGISGATSIGGATFTGTFPVVSNTFTIVPGGALGAIAVTAGGVVPVNITRVGATDVVLGNFIVSAGTVEDLSVSQLNVLASSTVLDTDVTNVRVKVDGVLQTGAATFSLRRATLNFSPAVLITKGTSRVFQVIGDVAAGVGRMIELGMQANGVLANGTMTGVGVAGPAATFYLGLPNDIVINRGGLSVSISTASPQGTAATVVKSIMSQTLGVYDIRATGENILVTNVNLTFTDGGLGATGTITTVGLYDEYGALLSNFQNLVGTAVAGHWGIAAVPFVINWTIPANTTMKLYVKGITNGITLPNPANVVPALVLVGGASITGTGLSSGGTEGAGNVTSASVLALPTMIVWQGPLFGITGDHLVTPRNQSILGPVSQAVVATIKVTGGREDQNLRSLTLTCNTTGANCAAYYSNVAIYDGATQVTNYVVPNATSVVFDATQIINVETFSVGVAKTLKVVANTLGIAAGTSSWAVAAGDMVTVGITSGQVAANAVQDLRVNSGGLGANTGGELTALADVLEMKVNAVSPAGTISRGTFAPVAKWDLISRGADAQGVDVTDITFTSKTGLASASDTDTALVRLYDETNGVVLSLAASTTITVANGTIRFQMATGTLRVLPTAVRVISLQMTTTNTTKFPAYSSMWFTVTTAANATVLAATLGGGARGTGYGGTVWSIPADAYQVSLTI